MKSAKTWTINFQSRYHGVLGRDGSTDSHVSFCVQNSWAEQWEHNITPIHVHLGVPQPNPRYPPPNKMEHPPEEDEEPFEKPNKHNYEMSI